MSNTRVVVLAAGKGTRMNSDIPKVLMPFHGKPMVQHLLASIQSSGVDSRPVVIVGYEAELIMKTLGGENDYVRQKEQLGTGHALQCAEPLLAGKASDIIVLYGDHPFVKAETIAKLRSLHERETCVLSLLTSVVEDFDEWRKPFYDFGRVIRDQNGDITAITELKDATPEEREIREVNPALYCFRAEWLWPNLKKIGNTNAKHEYYLTDLVRLAIEGGEKIASMDISPLESIGVNTPEHLELAKELA